MRTYSELLQHSTFEERFEYLKLYGFVGRDTFGSDRYLNQRFYTSREWRDLRSFCIARDYGCDLAVPGLEVSDKIIIHHMNPMTVEDLVSSNVDILNPEYLICTSLQVHNAIHYGDLKQIPYRHLIERRPGDTKLW